MSDKNKNQKKTADSCASNNRGFSPAEYSEVVDRADLNSIVLMSSEFNIDGGLFEIDGKEKKYSFELHKSKISYDNKKGVAQGEFDWRLDVRYGNKKLVKIKSVYIITYTGLQDLSRDAVDFFINNPGRIATYPYFRAHVSNCSWESGAELPLLPTISVEPPK